MRRKLLIGVLSIAMVFCMMPTFAFADVQNSGTEDNAGKVQGELSQDEGSLDNSQGEESKSQDDSIANDQGDNGATVNQDGTNTDTEDSQAIKKGTKVKASTTKQTVTSLLTFKSTTPSVNHLSDYGYSWDQDTMTLTLNNFTSSAEQVIDMVNGGKIVLKGKNAMTNVRDFGVCLGGDLSINSEQGASLSINLQEQNSAGIVTGRDGGTLIIDGGMYKFTSASTRRSTFALKGDSIYLSNASFTMDDVECAIYANGYISIINSKVTARVLSRGMFNSCSKADVNILNSNVSLTIMGTDYLDAVGIDLKYIDDVTLNIKDSNVVVNNLAPKVSYSGISALSTESESDGTYVKGNISPFATRTEQNYAIAVGGPITIDNSNVDTYSNGCAILCYTDDSGVKIKDEAGIKGTSGITLKNLTVAEGGSIQSAPTSQAGVIATSFATGTLILNSNDFPTNASKTVKLKSNDGNTPKKKGTTGAVTKVNTNADTSDTNLSLALFVATLSVLTIGTLVARKRKEN